MNAHMSARAKVSQSKSRIENRNMASPSELLVA